MYSCEPCMKSSKHVSATHICKECNERYCPNCTKDHNKFGALRGHIIVLIGAQFGSTEYDEVHEEYEQANQVHVISMAQNEDVACASDEYFEYNPAVLHGVEGASNHFYIDVDDTELSRRIGIDNKHCLLMIDPRTMLVSIAHNSVRKIDFSFAFVREYGHNKLNSFLFKLGRRCQFGEGELKFRYKDCRSLKEFISNSVKRSYTSATRSNKPE